MKCIDDKLKLRQRLPCVEVLPTAAATHASRQLPSVLLPTIEADHPQALLAENIPASLYPLLAPPPRPGA